MPQLRFLSPLVLAPPHRVTHPQHAIDLAQSLHTRGWLGSALVGYEVVNLHSPEIVQLLDGTHRRSASICIGLPAIPVMVWDYAAIQIAHGRLDLWEDVMRSGGQFWQPQG